MSHAESRVIPGDATLVWLASERATPLFRTLDRARAFDPLLILLAVLPAALAIFGETVTGEDAAWGLRALAVNGTELPPEVAAGVEAYVPADAVRPAGLWLSAGLMRLVDPTWPISGSLPSLIGGFLTIALFAPLAARLGGPRLAVWAVAIAAFHPTLVALLRFPAPVTLGLALAVVALWGYLAGEGRPRPRAWLAEAFGVAGGLVLMGPIAAAVPFVVAVDQALALLLVDRRKRGGDGAVAIGRLSAAVAGVLAAVLIDRVMPGNIGPSSGGAAAVRAAPPMTSSIAVAVGPLWGLAVLGVVRLVRVLRSRAAGRDPHRAPRLAAVWLAVAGGTVLWTGGRGPVGFDPAARYAAALTVLPLILVVSYAIEEAARRAVSGTWAAFAAALPLALRLVGDLAGRREEDLSTWAMSVVALGAAGWFVLRLLEGTLGPRGLRRGLLMAVLLAAVGAAVTDGIVEAVRRGDPENGFRRVTAQLEPIGPVEATVLLTEELPPPRLVFALRAAYPHAVAEVARTWEEASSRIDARFGGRRPRAVIATWGVRDGGGAIIAPELRPAGEPMLFQQRELLLYVRPVVEPTRGVNGSTPETATAAAEKSS